MDRNEFAQRLMSAVIPDGTPVEEINEKVFPISEAITQMLPQYLFRYRTCNERSIEALKNDLIYTVSADKINDPYDTLVRYDLDGIEEIVNAFISCETLGQLKAWLNAGNDFPESVKQVLPNEMVESFREKVISIEDIEAYKDRIDESRNWMISSIESYFPILAEMSKKFSSIACFSESIQSVLMWSHYADSHKGFAMEYDFRPWLKIPVKNVGLFPVIYDDERLDVSTYITWAFLRFIGIPAANPDALSYIKIALHKSTDWAYEKEWRLIDSSARDIYSDQAKAIVYKPVALYYGQQMSLEKKNTLHEIAREKGLREYEMFIDYSVGEYGMKWREYLVDR